MSGRYAPKRDDGLCAYVLRNSSPWPSQQWRVIVWAKTLKEAKAEYGYTRDQNAYRSLHRASPIEVASYRHVKPGGRP